MDSAFKIFSKADTIFHRQKSYQNFEVSQDFQNDEKFSSNCNIKPEKGL